MTGMVWSQISVGVAAILGLIYVARTLRGVVRESLENTAKLQSETLTFLGTHMSKNTRALGEISTRNTKALTEVGTLLAGMSERVDRLHDDNVESASLLLAQKDATYQTGAEIVEANQEVARVQAESLEKVQAVIVASTELEDESKRMALIAAADKVAVELAEQDRVRIGKVRTVKGSVVHVTEDPERTE